MAEKRTRRSFARELKAQAVKPLLEGGRGLSEVATERWAVGGWRMRGMVKVSAPPLSPYLPLLLAVAHVARAPSDREARGKNRTAEGAASRGDTR